MVYLHLDSTIGEDNTEPNPREIAAEKSIFDDHQQLLSQRNEDTDEAGNNNGDEARGLEPRSAAGLAGRLRGSSGGGRRPRLGRTAGGCRNLGESAPGSFGRDRAGSSGSSSSGSGSALRAARIRGDAAIVAEGQTVVVGSPRSEVASGHGRGRNSIGTGSNTTSLDGKRLHRLRYRISHRHAPTAHLDHNVFANCDAVCNVAVFVKSNAEVFVNVRDSGGTWADYERSYDHGG